MTTAELRAGDAQEFMVVRAGPAGLTAALELVCQELRPRVQCRAPSDLAEAFDARKLAI